MVDEVMIDEAQDLNPVQWEIIEKLTEKVPLFFVGDAQQSIYGFRYTDVAIFNKKAAEAKAEVRLEENFRSRESVLRAVNSLFQNLWGPEGTVPFITLRKAFDYLPQEDDFPELLLAEGADREQARDAEAAC